MEVDVHVVSGRYNRLQNPIRLVNGLHLQVENIAFNGLAIFESWYIGKSV